jgi:mannose-6-phosphate isomerase-like protein (cupin superfamily)
MCADSTPSLEYVPDRDTQAIDGDGVTWWSAITRETTACTAFEYGRATVEAGSSARITPPDHLDARRHEATALVTDGTGTVSMNGRTVELSPHDCLYLPAGVNHDVAGTDEPISFLWGVADHDKPPLHGDAAPRDGGDRARAIHTYRDIDPDVSHEPGNTGYQWGPVTPDTVGSVQCNVGLFRRPPGSGMDVRGHEPPTISEAFTVLEGRMEITDHDGTCYLLERNDFLFVPEHGQHANANVGADTLTYACIETPARSRTVSPTPESE